MYTYIYVYLYLERKGERREKKNTNAMKSCINGCQFTTSIDNNSTLKENDR